MLFLFPSFFSKPLFWRNVFWLSGYTNNDLIKMHKLNLDFYPAMRAIIAKEMQSVMQWW